MDERKPPSGRLALWIFLTAVLVRGLYLAQYLNSPLSGSYGVDHVYYLNWARRIAAGDWLGTDVFEQAPLYAYLLAAVFRLIGEQVSLVLMVQMVSGAGASVLVYACARRLFDARTAALAGFTAAVYGPLVFYECSVMKTFLSPILSLLVLYAGLRYAEEARARWLWLAGIALGLACLVGENHILLAIPLALWIWTCEPREQPRPRRRLLHIAIPVLALGLCLLPTSLRNWYVGGEAVLVTAGGGEVFYIAQGPQANGYYATPAFVLSKPGVEHEDFRREAERRTGQILTRGESSRYWFREGLRSIAADPGRALRLTAHKALALVNDYEVPDSADYEAAREFIPVLRYLPSFGWIAALGLLGIALALRSWRALHLPLGIVGAHTLSILLLYNFGRFRLGMVPVWILFAAYAATWLATAVRAAAGEPGARARHGQGAAVTGVMVILVLVTAALYQPRQPLYYDIHTALVTGVLASDDGDYVLAERDLRRALALRGLEIARDGLTSTRIYNLARTHQELAVVLYRTGRDREAAVQFALARQVLNRAEDREAFLRHELAVLRETMLGDFVSPPPSELHAELAAALAELRALRPVDLQYWAMSAVVTGTPQAAQAIAEGLEAVWHRVPLPSREDEAWYHAARAFLAHVCGAPRTADREARAALALWPGHPLRIELQALRQMP